MGIEVRPATDYEDVAAMLGPKRQDANVCWCLSYRLTSSKANRELVGRARGEHVRSLVRQEPPPGVLAYDAEEVVGWGAVHPRADTVSPATGTFRLSMISTSGRCGASGCGPDIVAGASPTTCSQAPLSSRATGVLLRSRGTRSITKDRGST
jgi:hypothetical protein